MSSTKSNCTHAGTSQNRFTDQKTKPNEPKRISYRSAFLVRNQTKQIESYKLLIMTVEKIKLKKTYYNDFRGRKSTRHKTSKIIIDTPENFTSLTIEQEEKIIKFFETL